MNKYSGLSSAELDRQIAERVMGWRKQQTSDPFWWFSSDGKSKKIIRSWRPSADETTFFRDVVPRMREKGFSFSVNINMTGGVWARFIHFNMPKAGHGQGYEFPGSACEAALLALDAIEKEDKK